MRCAPGLRLVDQMDRLLTMLLAVDSVDTLEAEGLYDVTILHEALRRYETIWLPLLAESMLQGTAHKLQPPIDVMFIQYVHRLAPKAYQRDLQAALLAAIADSGSKAVLTGKDPLSTTADQVNMSSCSLAAEGSSVIKVPDPLSVKHCDPPFAFGDSFASSSSSNLPASSLRSFSNSSSLTSPVASRSASTDSWSTFAHSVNRRSSRQASTQSRQSGTPAESTGRNKPHQVAVMAQQQQSLPPWRLSMDRRLTSEHFKNVKNTKAHWRKQAGKISQTAESYEGSSFASKLSCDILASAVRQKCFIANVFNAWIFNNTELAAKRYIAFLTLHKRHPDVLLVPTYDIDLAWHAHMMSPWQYRQLFGCEDNTTGSMLNHDDSYDPVSGEKGKERAEGFTATRELWDREVRPGHPHLLSLACNVGVLFKGPPDCKTRHSGHSPGQKDISRSTRSKMFETPNSRALSAAMHKLLPAQLMVDCCNQYGHLKRWHSWSLYEIREDFQSNSFWLAGWSGTAPASAEAWLCRCGTHTDGGNLLFEAFSVVVLVEATVVTVGAGDVMAAGVVMVAAVAVVEAAAVEAAVVEHN
eukprot:gene5102-5342_t